jgi:hypothetical protein
MRVDMFCMRWSVFSMVRKRAAPWEEGPLGERKQEKHGRDSNVHMRSAGRLSTSREVNKECYWDGPRATMPVRGFSKQRRTQTAMTILRDSHH